MHALNHIFFRFDATPLSGQSKGLLLVLDGHNDLVAASTVPDYFQVLTSERKTFNKITQDIYHRLVSGDGGNSGHKK